MPRTLSILALGALLMLMLGAPVLRAQDTDPAAPSDGAAPAEAEATEPSGPEYPPGLDDPDIPLQELQLRMLPLTADELAALADAWLGNARVASQAVVDQMIAIRNAGDAATDAQREERVMLAEERRRAFDRLIAVVASLEAKGGDPAVIASLRAYPAAIGAQLVETASGVPVDGRADSGEMNT